MFVDWFIRQMLKVLLYLLTWEDRQIQIPRPVRYRKLIRHLECHREELLESKYLNQHLGILIVDRRLSIVGTSGKPA